MANDRPVVGVIRAWSEQEHYANNHGSGRAYGGAGGHGWSKKRRHDGTDDGTPVGPYATGHCPVVGDVRRTHDGTLARGVVQATGQTMRHVSLPVVLWFVITFLTLKS